MRESREWKDGEEEEWNIRWEKGDHREGNERMGEGILSVEVRKKIGERSSTRVERGGK